MQEVGLVDGFVLSLLVKVALTLAFVRLATDEGRLSEAAMDDKSIKRGVIDPLRCRGGCAGGYNCVPVKVMISGDLRFLADG